MCLCGGVHCVHCVVVSLPRLSPHSYHASSAQMQFKLGNKNMRYIWVGKMGKKQKIQNDAIHFSGAQAMKYNSEIHREKLQFSILSSLNSTPSLNASTMSYQGKYRAARELKRISNFDFCLCHRAYLAYLLVKLTYLLVALN